MLFVVLAGFSVAACDIDRIFALLNAPRGETTDPVAKEVTRETIRSVQENLTWRGYNSGPADGVLGQQTVEAIRHYQADSGMTIDGAITPELVERLNASSEIPIAEQPIRPVQRESGTQSTSIVINYKQPDAIPVYEVGDTLAYSDGSIETVVRVGGGRVTWKLGNGDSYTSHRNFILPNISWQYGSASGEAETDIDPDDSWPLRPGRKISFAVSTTEKSTATPSLSTWSCWRERNRRVTVASGTFQTIVLACTRSSAPFGGWEKRVWYYSPAVRHYVRRDDEFAAPKQPRTVELVAIRPGGYRWPPAARAGLDWAIQDALRTLTVGKMTDWRSTAVSAEFEIMVTGNSARPADVSCRTYTLGRLIQGMRIYPAIACRAPESDHWLIPVLDRDKGAEHLVLSKGS